VTAPAIPKPDPKAWYTAIESHTSDLGTFLAGDRLRGDHPDVKANAIWWVEEGLSTEELHTARQARLAIAYPIKEK
jgi:hypothetical protein